MKKRGGQRGKSSNARLRSYLKSRGVPSEMADGWLSGAVARWESIAASVEGYDFSLDEWLNDMDLRDMIGGALETGGGRLDSPTSSRLERADDRFRENTIVTGPVWGTKVAESSSHDPARTWWYFRVPRNPGETLKSDLEAGGLV